MTKKLFTLVALLAVFLGANAYNVDDVIYTCTAKFQVTAANLVTNGLLSGTSLDGWNATDATSANLSDVFTVLDDGGVSVNPGFDNLNNGMYQIINISDGGIYVVTLKVKGEEPGYTDLDLNRSGSNYIFAYFNTDGMLAEAEGTEINYGEDGKAIENCYSFTNEDYTEFAFPVEAKSDGKIVIDIRGLSAGVEIKDIECHKVRAVFDERIAERRLAWIKSVLGDFEWSSEFPGYDDLQSIIKALEDALKGYDDFNQAIMLENLEEFFFDEFAPANLSNMFNTINHPEGTGGNYSANWMNWTNKYNTCNTEATNQPWEFNCERWSHGTAAENTPLQIKWQRGFAYNTWDPQARLTTTLDRGTYRLGITGSGGMMTLNSDRLMRSGAFDNVKIELILENAEDQTKNDTIVAGTLSPSLDLSFIGSFTLEEQKEVTILIHCYQEECLSTNPGMDVTLIDPVLYKVIDEGVAPTVPVTITSAGVASFSSIYPLDFTNSEVKAYIFTGRNGTKFVSQKVTAAPANTGLVIKAAEGTYDIPVAVEAVEPIETNWLVATSTGEYTVTADDYGYVYGLFQTTAGKIGFQKKKAGFTFGANKSYMRCETRNAADELDWIDADELTGITGIAADGQNAQPVYNLNGQRVNRTYKGIVITNGEKRVQK